LCFCRYCERAVRSRCAASAHLLRKDYATIFTCEENAQPWRKNADAENTVCSEGKMKIDRSHPRRLVAAAALLGAVCFSAGPEIYAQEAGSSRLLPVPEPFTLNWYDALTAAAMLRRVGFVELYTDNDSYRIIKVLTVRIVEAGRDPGLPDPYQARYDLLLNGRPVDWHHTYIEYNFRMVNLGMLFTYRNQRPVPDIPYNR